MKFSLFVHMERADPATPHRELFDDLEELVLMAEAAGFESAWIGEHHGMEFTIAPNPFVQLAYLAAKTTRIRLGTGNVIAPFWHPIRLAGEAAMMDIVSNGRLDLGIARGAYMFEYERLLPGARRLGRRPAHARTGAGDQQAVGGRLRPPGRVLVLSEDHRLAQAHAGSGADLDRGARPEQPRFRGR